MFIILSSCSKTDASRFLTRNQVKDIVMVEVDAHLSEIISQLNSRLNAPPWRSIWLLMFLLYVLQVILLISIYRATRG